MTTSIDISSLLQPELLVLIPVCWGCGLVLKAFPKFPNRFIPLLLAIVSISLSTLYIFSTCDGFNVGYKIFSSFTEGVSAWVISWIIYEKGIKQLQRKQNPKDETIDKMLESLGTDVSIDTVDEEI